MASKVTLALAFTLVAAVTSGSGSAFAQASGAAGATNAEREMARTLMGEGEEQRDRGDLHAALRSFQAADAIMHVPTTGLEVAKTQALLGRLLEAQELLLAVVRSPVKRNEPRPFTVAREQAKALHEDLERRTPAIAVRVTLADGTRPGSVTVTLDGTLVPESTLDMGRKINPGRHVIVVQAGDASGRTEVDVVEHETKTVTVKLPGGSEPASSPMGMARNDANPPEQQPRKPNYVAYTGFGVGAAGVAVGAVTGIVVLTNAGDLRDSCNTPPGSNTCTGNDADKLSSTKTWATVSTVAFIVGGAGLAVGTLALIFAKPDASKRAAAPLRPTVEPWFGLASAGVSGRF